MLLKGRPRSAGTNGRHESPTGRTGLAVPPAPAGTLRPVDRSRSNTLTCSRSGIRAATPDLDPYALAPGSGRRVWWRCESCGHEWQAQIQSRAKQGTGCPQCARVAVAALLGHVRRERSLAVLRPDLACALHPTHNGDLDSYSLGVSSHRKVWWQCHQCGHEWQAQVYTRAGSSGRCPNCHATIRPAQRFQSTRPMDDE
jgi:transposase-like protein